MSPERQPSGIGKYITVLRKHMSELLSGSDVPTSEYNRSNDTAPQYSRAELRERFAKAWTGSQNSTEQSNNVSSEKSTELKKKAKPKAEKMNLFSRRDFLKTAGVSVVTIGGLLSLPDWMMSLVESQERGVVYYIPLNEFLDPLADGTHTIDFASLLTSFPDVVKQTANGYEFVSLPDDQIILEFPGGKTITLAESNTSRPVVPIENVPLNTYDTVTPDSFDTNTTVGLVFRSDNISLVCSDAANPAVIDAKLLDKGIYAESLTGNGTFTAENITIKDYNQSVFDAARGLYRAAPAAISCTDLDLNLNKVNVCPDVTAGEESRHLFDAALNKVGLGVSAVFKDRDGSVQIKNSEILSHWDAVAVTGPETNVLVEDTKLEQTQQGWDYAARGAGIGVARAQREHKIVVRRSQIKAIKGIGSFWENGTESVDEPVIEVSDSTIETARWVNVGAFTITNSTLIENDYRNIFSGRGMLLNEQWLDPMISLDAFSSLRDVTIQIDSAVEHGKVTPIALLGHFTPDLIQPDVAASKFEGLKIQSTTQVEVEVGQLQTLLQNMKDTLLADPRFVSLGWKVILMWNVENNSLGVTAFAQNGNNSWEARNWMNDPVTRVEEVDPRIRLGFEVYKTAELLKPGTVDIQWVRDGTQNYAMKILNNITTGQQELWLHKLSLNPDFTVTEISSGGFTMSGPCYFAQVGESIRFLNWDVDGDETGYFEFEVNFKGNTVVSNYEWGRNISERDDIVLPLVREFEAELSNQAEQLFPGDVFYSGLNIATASIFSSMPQQRRPYFVVGYYDQQRRPILKMYSLNEHMGSNPTLQDYFNGTFFTGQPEEELVNLGFDQRTLEFSFAIQSGAVVSAPYIFSWGMPAPVLAGIEVVLENREEPEVGQGDTGVVTDSEPEVRTTVESPENPATAETPATEEAPVIEDIIAGNETPQAPVENPPLQQTEPPRVSEAEMIANLGLTPEEVEPRLDEYIAAHYSLAPEYIGPVTYNPELHETSKHIAEIRDNTLWMKKIYFDILTSTVAENEGPVYILSSEEELTIDTWQMQTEPGAPPLLKFHTSVYDVFPMYFEFAWGMQVGQVIFSQEHLAESKSGLLARTFVNETHPAARAAGNEIPSFSAPYEVTGGYHMYFVEKSGNNYIMKRLETSAGNSFAVTTNPGAPIVNAELPNATFEWQQSQPLTFPTLFFSFSNTHGEQHYSYTWGINSLGQPSIDVQASRSAIESMITSQFTEVSFHPTLYSVAGGHNLYFVSKDRQQLRLHRAEIVNNRFFIDTIPNTSGLVMQTPDIELMNMSAITWEDTPTPPPTMYFNVPNQGQYEYLWGRNTEGNPTRVN